MTDARLEKLEALAVAARGCFDRGLTPYNLHSVRSVECDVCKRREHTPSCYWLRFVDALLDLDEEEPK